MTWRCLLAIVLSRPTVALPQAARLSSVVCLYGMYCS